MLHDLPEDQLDVLLAARAADVYGFDRTALQAVADRIGPDIRQLKTPLAPAEWPSYPDQTRCTVFAPASRTVLTG
jgi:hypothetical protein